ncbi:MAG: hypothetical protein VX871_13170, partial [Pseudomonadota bacterium]|nr:hypothetical protein [Pseudomonadota bacterium]
MSTKPVSRATSIFRQLLVFLFVLLTVAAGAAGSALAQSLTIGIGGSEGGGVTERAVQIIALVTVLSLAPSILVMVTSFTRIVVVLSLLRTA